MLLFDVYLEDATAPGPLLSARLECPMCRESSPALVWNRRWNQLACQHCRLATRQFTNACPATLDPRTGRVGHAAAWQYEIDWRQYGPMGQCLGPGTERRVMVCLQFAARGLPARPVTVRCTARRTDSGREVAAWHDALVPCDCSGGVCKHNRIVHWLPPMDVWDQGALDCDVALVAPGGEVVLEDRIRCDISPPTLGQSSREEQTGDEAAETSAAADSPPPLTEAETVDRFHCLYYYGSADEHQVWVRTFWMNVPCVQCPLDLWVYQEIITELRPDLVVETGTLLGGTTLFLAHALDLVGKGKVVSIDLEDLPRPAHPRVEYVAGSSTDSALVRRLFAGRPAGETRLVILDSDHSLSHVLAELRLYAPLVTPGSYVIVTDSNVNGHPVFADYGPGPFEAVEAFLRETDEFVIDRTREKHKLTFNPNGYLKRVKPAPVAEPTATD